MCAKNVIQRHGQMANKFKQRQTGISELKQGKQTG